MIPVALTIAGSDSGGGAGVQADLKTFAAHNVFGASAITAVTAQNSMSVDAVHAIPADMVESQIAAVFADLEVGAIKIGMLGNADIVNAVAKSLRGYRGPVVLDPVLVATSGNRLLPELALDTLISELLPQVRLLTPNLPEAAALTRSSLATDEAAMVIQAKTMLAMGAQAVLIKGGHGAGETSVDVLVDATGTTMFAADRLDVGEIHGGGCIFSSAITAGLACGLPLVTAIAQAKHFITRVIAATPNAPPGMGAKLLHPDRTHRCRCTTCNTLYENPGTVGAQ